MGQDKLDVKIMFPRQQAGSTVKDHSLKFRVRHLGVKLGEISYFIDASYHIISYLNVFIPSNISTLCLQLSALVFLWTRV